MSLLSTCILERLGRQHATKTLPKQSPNGPKIQPKMLQNPMLCCDSRKLNPSKPSHTFAHFCCFQTPQNRPEIAQKRAQLQTYLRQPLEAQKVRFLSFLSWLLAPNLGPTWLYLGSKAAQKPPKMSAHLGHASTMAGRGPSEPKNPAKMSRIWFQHGSKFGSKGLHVQLGLELLRSCFYATCTTLMLSLCCLPCSADCMLSSVAC